MNKTNRATIRFTDLNFNNLHKLSYVSRRSLNDLVNEAVEILSNTPPMDRQIKEKV